jgi:hypothetical protein
MVDLTSNYYQSPTIFIFCRNQNEANEPQINTLKRKLIDSDSPDTPRKRHNSGHKVGFDNNWKLNRPWLECVENSMKCFLCTRHNMKNVYSCFRYILMHCFDQLL